MRWGEISRVSSIERSSPRRDHVRSAGGAGCRRTSALQLARRCSALWVVWSGLQCTSESAPQAVGVVELCEQVVTCLAGPEGMAPPYASSECAATAADLGDLAERLGAPPEPLAGSICDSLDPCAETFCRAEVATTIRQWDCLDYPVSGECTCVARLIGPASPLSFAAGDVCFGSECCFALSEFPGAPARRPVTGCGCIGGVDAQSCAAALAGDPELVQVESCPPRLGCAPAGAACDAQACCSGLSCRAEAAGQPRCLSVSETEGWQAACEAVASNRAFEGLTVVAGALSTSVGPLEFDRLAYDILETGTDGCLRRLTLSLRDDQVNSDCRLSLDVESRGPDLVVTFASGQLGACPGYSGGLFNDLYFGGSNSGIQVTFDGATCPARGGASVCMSGRFEFQFLGPSGLNDEQSVTFSDARIVIEGTICGEGSFRACEAALPPG